MKIKRLISTVCRSGTWMTLFVPCLLQAQDTLQIRTNYYPVTGSTLREIHQSLNKSRPRSTTSRHDGLTVWSINWRLSVSRQNNVCQLNSFTTKTTITVTLPLWVAPTNVVADVIKTWRDYIIALGKHEQGHVDFAKAAAAEMHQRVKTMGSRNDCGTLQKEINGTAQGILQTYRQREKEYDVQTRHGATQGATLPGREASGPAGKITGESGTSRKPR